MLMMELRHAQERAELIEQMTRDAYVAGLHDRTRPGTIGGALTLMEQITARVSEEYKMSVRELRGASRARIFNEPRRIIWCEAHDNGYSYPVIGRFFGRDHTSIIYGVKAHEGASA
jgi:chromosomal replication initiation ATPase DnaA